MVAAGQPVVAIANEGTPEIVVDVPEDDLAAFKTAPAIARRSQARLMMRSTSCCASCRRRRHCRPARIARG